MQTYSTRGVKPLFNDNQKQEIISFCQELVRIPSLPQQEGSVAEAIRRKMLSMGYDAAWIDDMGNVIGRMGTGRGPSLLFDGHIDTVGITDASS